MNRRGLTLLEVIAATALLTVVVAACLPMLAEARRWAESQQKTETLSELMRVADDFLVDPSKYGVDPDDVAKPGFVAEISTDSVADHLGIVSIQLLTAADADHAWLRFDAVGRSVLRYSTLPATVPARTGSPAG
tara:strand:+ start:390 stop:791 length:402 start_codon:yes stop_codon:yes gene_type:complete